MSKLNTNYAAAMKSVAESRDLKAANIKKAQALTLLAKDARVTDALKANNVDASRFSARALYASEKAIKIVYHATRDVVSVAELEANSFSTIKTCINALQHNERVTKRDIESAILAEVKVDDARAHIVYARKAKISATVQVQQCIDMMRTLNIAHEVARDVFEIRDCALMQTFAQKFEQVAL